MKHRVAGKKLNRSSKHRQALFKNLARELVDHGVIETSITKAKILKKHMDKHITLAQKNTLHSRRLIHAYFNHKRLTHRLVDVIAPSFTARSSGYTRITPIGPRRGDDAIMARIEFVDPIIEPEVVAPTKSTKPAPKPKSKPKS